MGIFFVEAKEVHYDKEPSLEELVTNNIIKINPGKAIYLQVYKEAYEEVLNAAKKGIVTVIFHETEKGKTYLANVSAKGREIQYRFAAEARVFKREEYRRKEGEKGGVNFTVITSRKLSLVEYLKKEVEDLESEIGSVLNKSDINGVTKSLEEISHVLPFLFPLYIEMQEVLVRIASKVKSVIEILKNPNQVKIIEGLEKISFNDDVRKISELIVRLQNVGLVSEAPLKLIRKKKVKELMYKSSKLISYFEDIRLVLENFKENKLNPQNVNTWVKEVTTHLEEWKDTINSYWPIEGVEYSTLVKLLALYGKRELVKRILKRKKVFNSSSLLDMLKFWKPKGKEYTIFIPSDKEVIECNLMGKPVTIYVDTKEELNINSVVELFYKLSVVINDLLYSSNAKKVKVLLPKNLIELFNNYLKDMSSLEFSPKEIRRRNRWSTVKRALKYSFNIVSIAFLGSTAFFSKEALTNFGRYSYTLNKAWSLYQGSLSNGAVVVDPDTNPEQYQMLIQSKLKYVDDPFTEDPNDVVVGNWALVNYHILGLTPPQQLVENYNSNISAVEEASNLLRESSISYGKFINNLIFSIASIVSSLALLYVSSKIKLKKRYEYDPINASIYASSIMESKEKVIIEELEKKKVFE